MFSAVLPPLLMLLLTSSLVSAGFRCSIGEFACSASCLTLGQTSGICDGEGECLCSEQSIRSVSQVNGWSMVDQWLING